MYNFKQMIRNGRSTINIIPQAAQHQSSLPSWMHCHHTYQSYSYSGAVFATKTYTVDRCKYNHNNNTSNGNHHNSLVFVQQNNNTHRRLHSHCRLPQHLCFSTLNQNNHQEELPGKPSFMADDEYWDDDDFLFGDNDMDLDPDIDNTHNNDKTVSGEDTIHVLEINTDLLSKKKSNPVIWNSEYDPGYDPDTEDQIDIGKKKAQEHRIITSTVKEDIVIEMEEISGMERIYTWVLVGCAFWLGRTVVRYYWVNYRMPMQSYVNE